MRANRRGLAVAALVTLLATGWAGCVTTAPVAVGGLYLFDHLPSGDPTPRAVGGCVDLHDELKQRTLAEAEARLDRGILYALDDVDVVADWAADGVAQPTTAPTARAASESEVTGTNNQEAGVEEADLVKTDGVWTYVLRGATLHILHSDTVGDLSSYGSVRFGTDLWPRSLLLLRGDLDDPDDDRLAVLGERKIDRSKDVDEDMRDMVGHHSGSYVQTAVYLYDLDDRTAPARTAVWSLDGSLAGARAVGGHVYVVVESQPSLRLPGGGLDTDLLGRLGIDWEAYWKLSEETREAVQVWAKDERLREARALLDNSSLEDHLPVLSAKTGDRVATEYYDESRCADVLVTPEATGTEVTSILAIDAAAATPVHTTTRFLGDAGIVYGAQDALVLATPPRSMWWFGQNAEALEVTDLHWFELDGTDVTHRASGRAPGLVHDQFALDVQGDRLRVATTTGIWTTRSAAGSVMASHLIVYEAKGGTLVPDGIVSGIAPGERIWSARFTAERAYLITFEQVDPLWIIDLTGANGPRILGELHIPGVSTYIHPLSDDLLLAIGYGPRDDGRGLDWGRLQLSLFDISDTAAPERAALLDLTPPNGHGHSSATREHKSFTYWSALGMLAIPFAWQEEGRYDGLSQVGLRLVAVDESEKTLAVHGDVDHGFLMPEDDEYGRWWGAQMERSHFLGDPNGGAVSVYALSPFGMTAHDVDSLALQDSVPFPLEQQVYGYYMD